MIVVSDTSPLNYLVLELAAEKGFLSLPAAIADFRRTTFRAPERLIVEMLRRDQLRNPRTR